MNRFRVATVGIASKRLGKGMLREPELMSVNFFEWIRDGVRQSVLLGVSDAIEQLGTPAETDDIHPGVAAFMASEKGEKKRVGAAPVAAGGNASGNRKRLGRSLKDIDEPAAA
jgi:hypothetical protein